MKNRVLAMSLIFTLCMPLMAAAQEGTGIDLPENIQIQDINPGEVLSFVQKLLVIGEKIASVVSDLFTTLNTWFEDLTGMTLIDLFKELFQVAIDLFEMLLDAIINVTQSASSG